MSEAQAGQRIDRWLWHARLVKTRTLAARLAAGGQVRIDRRRVTRASQQVHVGAVVTLAHRGVVRVLRVTAISPRRGPAEAARALYDDLAPPPPTAPAREAGEAAFTAPAMTRPRGAGRPTKRERRALDALMKARGN